MILKRFLYYGLFVLLLLVSIFASSGANAQSNNQIIITEIQTGGVSAETGLEDPFLEFIELYNNSEEAIPLYGLELQYLTEKHTGVETPTRVIAPFVEGDLIEPKSFYVISYVGYITNAQKAYPKYSSTGQLPKTSGSVRLYDKTLGLALDTIGYGGALQNEVASTKAPVYGSSAQRCMQGSTVLDTNNNVNDFATYTETTPFGIPACIIEEPQDPVVQEPPVIIEEEPIIGDSPTAEIVQPKINTCAGVVLSEILPNPAGADAGQEFIELFNKNNSPTNLSGCYLQLEGSAKRYVFGETILAPFQYVIFKDSTTLLTLPNSSGDTVSLYDANDTLLSSVAYAGGLDDDVSWANVDNNWVATYQVSPNEANIAVLIKPCPTGQIRSSQTNRCINIVPASSQINSACPAGQERNPATNRCRNVLVSNASSLVICKPGQERNPLTNRCRTIASSVSALVACKPGQERNPATNRCRNIVVATSAKPCPAGQERNPETNRCRKIVSSDEKFVSTLGVTDIPTTKGDTTGIVLAGLIALFAIIYGLWAWRDDIRIFAYSYIARFKK